MENDRRMNAKTNILFFGSTTDSVIVLEKITGIKNVAISAIVTQPPRPVGREQILTPTPVETWAKKHNIVCLSFPSSPEKSWQYQNPQQVVDTLQPVGADLIISASYGQMIPAETIKSAKYGGLNVHPSILPRWRGGDPVPWAIMTGDHQIGVSVVSLSAAFDAGDLYAQEKIPLLPTDTSDPLRTKLFTIGADLLVSLLPDYLRGKAKPLPSHKTKEKPPYAKRFTRDNGFEPWEAIIAAVNEGIDAERIDRKYRALHPWPGVWTTVKGKRLKILAVHTSNGKLVPEEVQLEGKKPVAWTQFHTAYLAS